MDFIGRRLAIVINSVVFIVGAIILALAPSFTILVCSFVHLSLSVFITGRVKGTIILLKGFLVNKFFFFADCWPFHCWVWCVIVCYSRVHLHLWNSSCSKYCCRFLMTDVRPVNHIVCFSPVKICQKMATKTLVLFCFHQEKYKPKRSKKRFSWLINSQNQPYLKIALECIVSH